LKRDKELYISMNSRKEKSLNGELNFNLWQKSLQEEKKVNKEKFRLTWSKQYILMIVKVNNSLWKNLILNLGQFLPLLKVTFWEKLGFKNKKKEE
jgi:hypothetical protein